MMSGIMGTSFDNYLKDEGIYEEVAASAIKRAISSQLEETMEQQGVSQAEMARRMNTSRSALSRLLDPENESVTLTTLQKAASAIGRELHIELI